VSSFRHDEKDAIGIRARQSSDAMSGYENRCAARSSQRANQRRSFIEIWDRKRHMTQSKSIGRRELPAAIRAGPMTLEQLYPLAPLADQDVCRKAHVLQLHQWC
jgi:hypothetical protein